jgi:hypothetical protein
VSTIVDCGFAKFRGEMLVSVVHAVAAKKNVEIAHTVRKPRICAHLVVKFMHVSCLFCTAKPPHFDAI